LGWKEILHKESPSPAYRSLAGLVRSKDIAGIIIKYGLRDFVDRCRIPDLGLAHRITGIEKGLPVYARIRMVLEELGPTFIKFGQLASMRPDLVPPELLSELEKLQDSVPPEPFADVEQKLEAELGPLEAIFKEFDTEPVAAASLSQVHRAVLRDTGEVVAVKVRRPKAFTTIQADLNVLACLASRLHDRYPELQVYNLPALVEELRYSINNELDFLKEAANIKVFRAAIDENSLVTAPKVYDAYTTRKVLTMGFVEGVRVSKIDLGREQRRKLAEAGLEVQINQILRQGFFHADPHAGNVLITPEGRICLLDWGMVGRLTHTMRRDIIDLLLAILDRDEERVTATARRAFDVEEVGNPLPLQRDIRELLDTFFATDRRHRSVGHLLIDFLAVFQKHRVAIPAQYAFMSKALFTMEGLGQQIYPELDIPASVKPHLQRLVTERTHPAEVARRNRNQGTAAARLVENLPERADRIFRHLEKGEIAVRFEGTQKLEEALVKSSNRLTTGIILGSMILGSSVMTTAAIPPLLFGHSALGMAGFAFSGILGLRLLLDIRRERRR